VVLFGSIAQNKEKPTSDIDILVILSNRVDPEKAEAEIISQGAKFVEQFGNLMSGRPYQIFMAPSAHKRCKNPILPCNRR